MSRLAARAKQGGGLTLLGISVVPFFLAGFLLWILMKPFRMGADLLPYVQADFYYSLQIAQNLAAGHRSTFDGLVATNGYHPLWLLLLSTGCFFFTILHRPIYFAA